MSAGKKKIREKKIQVSIRWSRMLDEVLNKLSVTSGESVADLAEEACWLSMRQLKNKYLDRKAVYTEIMSPSKNRNTQPAKGEDGS